MTLIRFPFVHNHRRNCRRERPRVTTKRGTNPGVTVSPANETEGGKTVGEGRLQFQSKLQCVYHSPPRVDRNVDPDKLRCRYENY